MTSQKFEYYSNLSKDTIAHLQENPDTWKNFLRTAAQLYKYSFSDQVLIYAQRPNATAVAEYSIWNEKMGRYVRQGTTGIALLNRENNKLRYVYDLPDTAAYNERSRTPWQWRLQDEHKAVVAEHLEQCYHTEGETLVHQLAEASGSQITAYWEENKVAILESLGDVLGEHDVLEIQQRFVTAATSSVYYCTLCRCTGDSDRLFDQSDYLDAFNLGSIQATVALGNVVSSVQQEILRGIENTIRKYERSKHYGIDVQTGRGRSDPEHRPGRPADGGYRSLRQDERTVSEGAPEHEVRVHETDGDVVRSPGRSESGNLREGGQDRGTDGAAGRNERSFEAERSSEMGGSDGKLQGVRRGDRPSGDSVRITQEEPADVGSLVALESSPNTPLFPTESNQLSMLDLMQSQKAEGVIFTPSAFQLPQEVTDLFLIHGSNSDFHRMAVLSEFSKGRTQEEQIDFLRGLYHGGNGIEVNGRAYSAWYAFDGIHIASGHTARYARTAQIIPWTQAAQRMTELITKGQFATNVEIAEAPAYERKVLSEKLWYLASDLSEAGMKENLLPTITQLHGGFPAETALIQELLQDTSSIHAISQEMTAFLDTYENDRSILRFHYHNPKLLAKLVKEQEAERLEFHSDLTSLPEISPFITEDELEASFVRGSGIAGGKYRIYSYFTAGHTTHEQAEFLKKEYGNGGRSHALSGSSGSEESHDNKGVVLKKKGCADISLSWEKVARRIQDMVQHDRYLSQTEMEQLGVSEQFTVEKALEETIKEMPEFQASNQERPSYKLAADLDSLAFDFDTYDYNDKVEDREAQVLLIQDQIDQGRIGEINQWLTEILAGTDADLASRAYDLMDRISQLVPEPEKSYTIVPNGHSHNVLDRVNIMELLPDGTMGHSLGIGREDKCIQYTRALNSGSMTPETVKEILTAELSKWHCYIIPDLASWNTAIAGDRVYTPIEFFDSYEEAKDRFLELRSKSYLMEDLMYPNPGEPAARLTFGVQRENPPSAADLLHVRNNQNYLVDDFTRMTALNTSEEVMDLIRQMKQDLGFDRVRVHEKNAEGVYLPPKDLAYADWKSPYFIPQTTLEKAKYLIDTYSRQEFGNLKGADYSDMTSVGVGYTTTEDDQHEIQATVDLEHFRIETFIDNVPVRQEQFQSLEDLVENALPILDFDELTYVSDDEIALAEQKLAEKEMSLADDAAQWEAEQASAHDEAIAKLSPDQKIVVQAWEAAGFTFVPDENRSEIIFQDQAGYPLTFKSWEDARQDIEKAELKDTPELKAAVRGILQNDLDIYNETKAQHPDDLVLFQVGDFFEIYGEDAKTAAGELNLNLTTRSIPGAGQVPMCGFPANMLEQMTDKLRDRHDVTISAVPEYGAERQVYSMPSIDHEAEQAIDAHEAEFGADGERVFHEPNYTDREYAAQNLVPGVTEFMWDDRRFLVESVNTDIDQVELRDITFQNASGFPIFRVEHIGAVREHLEAIAPQVDEQTMEVSVTNEVAENLPIIDAHQGESGPKANAQADSPVSVLVDGEWKEFPNIQTAQQAAYEEYKSDILRNAQNFHITDDGLGSGGAKEKFKANVYAIQLLKELEADNRQALPDQQKVLSRYVGWGGLADAFDPNKPAWKQEYAQLKEILTPEEYESAKGSTLNAHYTSPTIIRSVYEAVENMGFQTGNILEPAMGTGNFFGMLPPSMDGSKLYGVELDSISGRIAKQLYPQADITIAGFETTDRKDFYDLVVGNVPFGNYQVNDKDYNKYGFSIHNYFIAKSINQVRRGGVVAVLSSRYTMDAKNSSARRFMAQRAELLGAIRLPNNAFKANAGAEVVSDILFFQRREKPTLQEPDWVQSAPNEQGHRVNQYFLDHPEMVLGIQTEHSTAHGMDYTVEPGEIPLEEALKAAVQHIQGSYHAVEPPELAEDSPQRITIPADPSIKNYSYSIVDGELYYRENSIMYQPEVSENQSQQIKGMVEIRQVMDDLIAYQVEDYPDAQIQEKQAELNTVYDAFTKKYGILNSRANEKAFSDDDSYYRLAALEHVDEDRKLERKADIFSKRTIRATHEVERVDSPSDALIASLGNKGRVDLPYMSQLLGGEEISKIIDALQGAIYRDPSLPEDAQWVTADEYLSGNVREKLAIAQQEVKSDPSLTSNVQALTEAQPKPLEATEIDVRLGATWVDPKYIQAFMHETFQTPYYRRYKVKVEYSSSTGEWKVGEKGVGWGNDVMATSTFGTTRATAYQILEDSLNLRDTRVNDYIEVDGKKKTVLNQKETTLAAQKQQAIHDAFSDWIWKDPERRNTLVTKYNELYNSCRPREYDGSHIVFGGINPDIKLREHQLNAVAHILYGGNTLLAHEVGAGKSFEMIAAAMESKRLGQCEKSMFVVPNHLILQWANEFLRLYPAAHILVTTRKDFEPANRKKFCARIATGDYDAVIIGQSQFEKIPVSLERQQQTIEDQLQEIEDALYDQRWSGKSFTVKQLEKTKKSLEARLEKLMAEDRKDNVVYFEQLGVDRLFVDESQAYKNLYFHTKMRNVAGLSTSESQRSTDMYMKCRYMDELTGGRGVIFASGTPVSNSMSEMYTLMRYLQHDTLTQHHLTHFDNWASTFGQTTTAIELAPEGTGYRARTRFAKFYNLPELMTMFKEVADIKTADQLHLPVPEAKFETIVVKPSDQQKAMVEALSERAAEIHAGNVDPSSDNMLKVTSDGKKIGLDQRLINPMLPDDPNSKVNACIEKVYSIWEDGAAEKLTQMIFCDMSTPGTEGTKKQGFNVYDDIKEKLVRKGIPSQEIAFIHDANTDKQKKDLFTKVRKGHVRVLLGSTKKMGAGTNCQDKLIALHHLDVPWRPSDMTQRNGRIIRQGNQNPEVQIYQYVTEATFDAYLYQTLENKQRFISQIMTAKSPMRSCEDIDDSVLSYAEIKALCAGNPLIKEKMDLDIQVANLQTLKSSYLSEHYRLEDKLLTFYPREIQNCKERIAGHTSDITLAQATENLDVFSGLTIGKSHFSEKKDAGQSIIDFCKHMKKTNQVKIGSYRGFELEIGFNSFTQEYTATLRGQVPHTAFLSNDPFGNITRLDNALAHIPDRLEKEKAQLLDLQSQQEAAKEELRKPFLKEDELKTKSARLAELNVELDMNASHKDISLEVEPTQPSEEPTPVPQKKSLKDRLADAELQLKQMESTKPTQTHSIDQSLDR